MTRMSFFPTVKKSLVSYEHEIEFHLLCILDFDFNQLKISTFKPLELKILFSLSFDYLPNAKVKRDIQRIQVLIT